MQAWRKTTHLRHLRLAGPLCFVRLAGSPRDRCLAPEIDLCSNIVHALCRCKLSKKSAPLDLRLVAW